MGRPGNDRTKADPRGCLADLLRELPREDLLFALLGYGDGLTDTEMAQVLAVDSAAVARRRFKLITRLRSRLSRSIGN